MDNYNVLIVEDNIELSDMIRNYLIKSGHNVFQAFNGKQALMLCNNIRPSIVMLDIMLPDIDGFTICKEFRKQFNIPIIVMSAKESDEDKEKMFDLGADDYLTKPFSLKEAVMHVNAQLRRYYIFNKKRPEKVKNLNGLVISKDNYTVEYNGENVILSKKEFVLLDVLTDNPDRIFDKNKLMELVWGNSDYYDENTVAVTIARLREKLKNVGVNNIVTIWGFGYKWQSIIK